MYPEPEQEKPSQSQERVTSPDAIPSPSNLVPKEGMPPPHTLPAVRTDLYNSFFSCNWECKIFPLLWGHDF